jgi:Putative prokaryotic signal transducing protein
MKKLLSFETSFEAELLRGRLETAGISCDVQGGAYVDVTFPDRPSVWIARDEDWTRALEIANESPPPSAWPWTCVRCREKNESAFDACWSCGTARS